MFTNMRLFWTFLIVCLVFPDAAMANGRFPATVSVHSQPDDNQRILLGSTFGLLLSEDNGNSFYWICEAAIGYAGTYDPEYAIASDGGIFATTFDGLRVSRDNGCTWEIIRMGIDGYWVSDVEIAANGWIWTVTSSTDKENGVFISKDNGASFQNTGLVHENTLWRSIKISTKDPLRAYLAGFKVQSSDGDGGIITEAEAVFYRTDNGGESWTELNVSTFLFGIQPQISIEGILHNNEDTVFVRAVTSNLPIGDRIYRSTDKGEGWEEVLVTEDTIRSFLVLSDDSTIFAGTINDGVYWSKNQGHTWTRPTVQPQMACLAEHDSMLLSCGSNWEPDNFALGGSENGENWEKKLRFSGITGVLSCPTGTIQHDTCEQMLWPELAGHFGIGTVDDAGVGNGNAGDAGSKGGGGGGCGGCNLAVIFFAGLIGLRRRESPWWWF